MLLTSRRKTNISHYSWRKMWHASSNAEQLMALSALPWWYGRFDSWNERGLQNLEQWKWQWKKLGLDFVVLNLIMTFIRIGKGFRFNVMVKLNICKLTHNFTWEISNTFTKRLVEKIKWEILDGTRWSNCTNVTYQLLFGIFSIKLFFFFIF